MKSGGSGGWAYLLSVAVVLMAIILPPRWIALPILAVAITLFYNRKSNALLDLLMPSMLCGLSVWLFLSNSGRVVMVYPVIINAGLFIYFWQSLKSGQTAIERLARIEQPDLPFEAIGYTRILTQVWCGFFILNGATSILTVAIGDMKLWALYNGLISYVLIGVLILGERLLRPRLIVWNHRHLLSLAISALDLLNDSRSPDDIICVSESGVIKYSDFANAIRSKAAVIAKTTCEDWIIDSGSGYHFLVDLLAVCLCGRHAIIPQNFKPETLVTTAEKHRGALKVSELTMHGDLSMDWRVSAIGKVSFYTSGTSGTPKCITHNFSTLLKEAASLENLFGGQLKSARMIGTVPHHFIYGLIFRYLWPLTAKRVFYTEPLVDGYAIMNQLSDGAIYALVSSPSLLERLPADDFKGLGGLSLIFSSGSFLRYDVALRWASPVEVYGSTETGGIAWRRQFIGGEAWMPFPCVSISTANNHCLKVESPFVAKGCGVTSDVIKLLANRSFELMGRVDRIVKVEGRRVSLSEIEAIVQAHPAVLKCVITQLDGVGRLAAIVVPRFTNGTLDYQTMVSEIKLSIGKRHDTVVVPRRWKFLPFFPTDSRGKLTREHLQEIFNPTVTKLGPGSCWPQLMWHEKSENELILKFKVPERLVLIEGHFPGLPILPGVILILWASWFGEVLLGKPLKSRGVDNLKFTAAVYPGEVLELTLTRGLDDSVKFRFSCLEVPKAAGTLLSALPQNEL